MWSIIYGLGANWHLDPNSNGRSRGCIGITSHTTSWKGEHAEKMVDVLQRGMEDSETVVDHMVSLLVHLDTVHCPNSGSTALPTWEQKANELG
ncbi:hypothetical protein Ancab_015760 [Ancistrocladus abbreviatus]